MWFSMRSLIVGNGAREHIIAERMAESSDLYAYMSKRNPGIMKMCKGFELGDLRDFEKVGKFANRIGPDYVFVGPEDPLAKGIADSLDRVIGPDRELARLESDKGFCKEFLKGNLGWGYPEFEVCTSYGEAVKAIDRFGEVAVKPGGLTAGKGVKVMGHGEEEDAKKYAAEVLSKRIGGMEEVVIEEKLEGEEFTLQAFTDGDRLEPMPLVQDHKHAYENDVGPMTGGMGSYSDSDHLLPFLSKKEYEEALKIMEATLKALRRVGRYRGVLYGGFMLTAEGPKLLEYNVRFGDPEAMNVLPLLKNDFSEVCLSIIEGKLKRLEFEQKATVCKYLVPRGYPVKPESGKEVSIDEEKIEKAGARVYYASVDERGGKVYTSSSRSFGIVGIGQTIEEAEEKAERAIAIAIAIASASASASADGLFHRSDIGKGELVRKRVEHMRRLRLEAQVDSK
jgi:phosphoribosylamine--glycine ligase